MKMSKSKIAKYRITDTSIDKEIIGKQVTVEKIRAKGGRVGPTTKKQKSTRDLLIEFMGEQREFNKSVIQRFDEQAKFNKSIREDLNRLIKLNNLKH
jgi:hypothetical protein